MILNKGIISVSNLKRGGCMDTALSLRMKFDNKEAVSDEEIDTLLKQPPGKLKML